MQPNFFIVVTAYGGSTENPCVASIAKLIGALHASRIRYSFTIIDQIDIALTRNIAATYFLRDQAATHLLFIDHDGSFQPSAVLRMREAAKPVIGCIFPKRAFGPNGDIEFASRVPPEEAGKPIAKVESIGMALTLIERATLTTMRDRKVCNTYNIGPKPMAGITGEVYGFFDCIPGHQEDRSFCKRWTKCGGEIFALTDEEIGHVGKHMFVGKFLSSP